MRKKAMQKLTGAEEFGKYLVSLREAAGPLSQDEVVRRSKHIISKSSLSLYERGQIQSLRPDIARIFSEIYQVPYAELVSQWMHFFFGTHVTIEHESFVISASRDECALQGPSKDDQILLISLEELRRQQEALPDKSEVGVAALNFLDNDIFFDMVSKNIRRGVRYYYLLPEDERITYKVFVSRLATLYKDLQNKLDGERTHFIPRSPTDFPINYVVYVFPNGNIQGFVGLLFDKRVQYCQVTDQKLSMRLYQAFSVTITLAKDSALQSRLHELYRLAAEKSMGKNKPSLALGTEK